MDIAVETYRFSHNKLKEQYKSYIICKERESFSFDNIFGIDY